MTNPSPLSTMVLVWINEMLRTGRVDARIPFQGGDDVTASISKGTASKDTREQAAEKSG